MSVACTRPRAARGYLLAALFLSAVLLFMMTFIVNTVAEVIRQRLRNKNGPGRSCAAGPFRHGTLIRF